MMKRHAYRMADCSKYCRQCNCSLKDDGYLSATYKLSKQEVEVTHLINWRPLMLIMLLLLSQHLSAELANGLHTIKIEAQPLQLKIERMGQADYRHLTQLSFQSAGYIEQLSLDEGDLITESQIIASLDTSILKANLAAAKADYANAVSDLTRAETLFKEKTVSADYLENAQTLLKTRRAQLEVTRFNLRKAQIKAPFDGIIIARLAQSGELVNPGTPVYQVARQSGDYIVRLALTQEEIALIDKQQPVQLNLAGSQTLIALVDKIATRTNPATGMYEIEIALPLQHPKIRAGQWLNLSIQLTQPQQVFAIPLRALNKIEKEQAFFMIRQHDEVIGISSPILHFDHHAVYIPAAQETLELVMAGWGTQPVPPPIKGL